MPLKMPKSGLTWDSRRRAALIQVFTPTRKIIMSEQQPTLASLFGNAEKNRETALAPGQPICYIRESLVVTTGMTFDFLLSTDLWRPPGRRLGLFPLRSARGRRASRRQARRARDHRRRGKTIGGIHEPQHVITSSIGLAKRPDAPHRILPVEPNHRGTQVENRGETGLHARGRAAVGEALRRDAAHGGAGAHGRNRGRIETARPGADARS